MPVSCLFYELLEDMICQRKRNMKSEHWGMKGKFTFVEQPPWMAVTVDSSLHSRSRSRRGRVLRDQACASDGALDRASIRAWET